MKPLLIAGAFLAFSAAVPAFAQSTDTSAPADTSSPAAASAPADTSAPAAASTPADSSAPAASADTGDKPYKVVDGNKVDDYTMKGFKAWRAASCDRCHGPNQEGLVGPSLIEGLKVLTKAEFMKTVHDGRPEKGMPSFAGSPTVMDNLENLYAYLKGRSDGAITSAHVEPMQ